MKSIIAERYPNVLEKQKHGEQISLLYNLSGRFFAISLEEALDIVIPDNVRSVPGAESFFRGVFIYEETHVYIIKTHSRLELSAPEKYYTVICKIEGLKAYIAIEINSIIDFIDSARLRPQQEDEEASFVPAQFVRDIYNYEGSTILELKLKQLVGI